jgi:hypothetical protein
MSIRVPERALNPEEARVLDRLLAVDFPDAGTLRAQLPHARVVGRCDCGCATVDLSVDRSRAKPATLVRGRPIPSEAVVLGDNAEPIGGVIVFLDDGYLSMLEVYAFGNSPIQEWPPLDRLEVAKSDR